MAVISHKNKFIFFQNPRTGSTMLEKVLIENYDGTFFPEPKNHSEKMDFKHLTYNELIKYGYISKRELDNYFKFTSVRNPFHKAVSDWQGGKKFFKENKGKQRRIENILARDTDSLEDYLKLLLLKGMPISMRKFLAAILPNFIFYMLAKAYGYARKISNSGFIIDQMDMIIQTEKLQDGFDEFCKRNGLNNPGKLPMINKTYSIDLGYEDYHTPISHKLVKLMYKDIIERFGYKV